MELDNYSLDHSPNSPTRARQIDDCPECGAEMEVIRSGEYKRIEWYHVRCTVCGYEDSEEPDFD